MNVLSIVFIVVIFGGMMFFMQRNQRKQQAQRKEQLDAMQPGAQIITIGGLHGVLSSVNIAQGTIELDCEGVILTFDRAAVKTVKNGAAEAETTTETTTTENPIEEN
ncbi:preprotein translocase subunit YajC [Lactococcus nasutitermitis]|uniref:Preprotein translocase subunit YajC n=1 Tax=Lactococcus nasutitermitis TaxID=1652957 RepID=A0ABV9JEK3_9LACT|nr:preprotein translocase subunit YajC [Lactococcus nasutitermitis]